METTVRCGGVSLPIFKDGAQTFFPMKAICECLGLSWRAEFVALKPPYYNPVRIKARVSWSSTGDSLYLELNDFRRWLRAVEDPERAQKALKAVRNLKYRLRTDVYLGDLPTPRRPLKIPSVLLLEVMRWHAQRYPSQMWLNKDVEIERAFNASFGCSLHSVSARDLPHALTEVCRLLVQLEERLDRTADDHLDNVLQRLVTTVRYGASANRSDVSAVICALERSYADDLSDGLDVPAPDHAP